MSTQDYRKRLNGQNMYYFDKMSVLLFFGKQAKLFICDKKFSVHLVNLSTKESFLLPSFKLSTK